MLVVLILLGDYFLVSNHSNAAHPLPLGSIRMTEHTTFRSTTIPSSWYLSRISSHDRLTALKSLFRHRSGESRESLYRVRRTARSAIAVGIRLVSHWGNVVTRFPRQDKNMRQFQSWDAYQNISQSHALIKHWNWPPAMALQKYPPREPNLMSPPSQSWTIFVVKRPDCEAT